MKQKTVPKETDRKITEPGELMYLDTSNINQTSMGGKKYWFLFVDGYSDLSISRFGKQKSDLPKIGVTILLELKTKGITVKSIRCDNAGENKAFEQQCKLEGLLVNFEYTAPGTPQQNGVAERKFATLFGKVRAMNTAAGLQGDIRSKLWAEAANCATDLDCLLIKELGGTSPFELFYGYKAPYSSYLRTFGEIGIIRNIATVKPKLDDRGTPAMFLGYAKQHTGNVYRMLDLGTHKLRLARDVEWLSKSYQEYVTCPQNREDDGNEDDSQIGIGEEVPVKEVNSTNENQTENQTTDDEWQEVRAGRDRLIFQPAPSGQTRSGSSYKTNTAMLAHGIPTSSHYDDEFVDSNEEYASIQAYVLYAEGKFEEPKSFEEAWNHTDENERKGWRDAIKKEFHDMNFRKVWRKFKKNQIPKHQRLIGCKWVFKKKKDGRFRARLCALGCSQIPGEDFLDTSKVYMKCPEGIEHVEDGWIPEEDCAKLEQTIYGTKQAARQYQKKFMSKMEEKGFERTYSEPCLLKRVDNNGTVVICVYVDDCLLVGDRKTIDAAVEDIGSAFETRRLEPLDEYIGCSVVDQYSGSKKLIQPDMVKKIEKEFGDAVSYLKNVKVPMASGISVIRPTEDDPLLSPEDQKDYRSAVGMLLYLVKHSRPDLRDAVRELSKVMSGASNDHVKLLHQVIKFA
ncbi:reverse transcriptase RNA-dependent DNA polymerase [Nitzschia inconspicua]|uniref:Reverse transcriptase RNA-dependent DNA polymerase n=1 Tax=Nitzschia inconspicua TaxID=303405 RepID=A0A9K3L978_9STRA|nr:reverse transcriptase RNA-dependent DNA polymerase [Nitzschia inconspicua]